MSGIKSDCSLWTWGYSGYGEIGDNTRDNRSSPVLVVGNHSFIMVAVGSSMRLALKSDGSVWAWGKNTYGQLGDNSISSKSSPILVTGNHSFVAISAFPGEGFSAALKSDGSAWSWGCNNPCLLGNNTKYVSQSSPVLVVGNHSFTTVECGAWNTFALKSDGSLWTWGQNGYGGLGINATGDASSPVLVVGGHSFVSVKSGTQFALALKADGSVWSWGFNSSGQLGDNTINDKSSPVLVVGNHSFVAISRGGTFAFALKADGSVWSWGSNSSGQLGDNTINDKSSPVLVVGAHSFVEISYSASNSPIARKENGEIWGWGWNSSGQLGDNTIVSRSSPVLVAGNHSFSTLSKLPMPAHHFRFRNDDGTEATATWIAAEDVNITRYTPFRLRFLIDGG